MKTIAAERRDTGRKKSFGGRRAVRRKNEPLSRKEKRVLLQLVACGSARGKAPYARTLNETAAFLWKQLELERDEAAIIAALTEEYGIDEQTARAAYASFTQKLRESGYLLEE